MIMVIMMAILTIVAIMIIMAIVTILTIPAMIIIINIMTILIIIVACTCRLPRYQALMTFLGSSIGVGKVSLGPLASPRGSFPNYHYLLFIIFDLFYQFNFDYWHWKSLSWAIFLSSGQFSCLKAILTTFT